MLPDFLLIGGQRCGTTSLAPLPLAAPRVGMAFRKEVSFFDVNWPRGERWYRAHFPSALSRRARPAAGPAAPFMGEATPYYLFHPAVPARPAVVAERAPDRACSASRCSGRGRDGSCSASWARSRSTFEEAIAAEPGGWTARSAGCWPTRLPQPRPPPLLLRQPAACTPSSSSGGSVLPARSAAGAAERRPVPEPAADDGRASTTFLGLPIEPSDSYPVAQNATARARIPARTRTLLRERFREPNERLFELLGERLGVERRVSGAPILITGSHRSGTTWVGRTPGGGRRLGYIDEPFSVLHRPGCCAAQFDAVVPVRHGRPGRPC